VPAAQNNLEDHINIAWNISKGSTSELLISKYSIPLEHIFPGALVSSKSASLNGQFSLPSWITYSSSPFQLTASTEAEVGTFNIIVAVIYSSG
jgi:hypothetical protein